MTRISQLAAASAVFVLFALVSAPAAAQEPSCPAGGGISLFPALLQDDDWGSEEFDEEMEEIPQEEPLDEEVEEVQPPPAPEKPVYRPQRQPRGRGARGWRQGRYQTRVRTAEDYRKYAESRFRGSPRQFTVKLGIDGGLLGSSDAGEWDEYWGGVPSYDGMFDYELSVALDAGFRVCPFFEIVAGLSHVRLSGHTVYAYPGSWIEFDDMTMTSLWVGPKITLPLSLAGKYWMTRQGLRDSRSVNFYFIPLSVGFASLSKLGAEYSGGGFDYYESDLNLYLSTRVGFEMHFYGFGFFLEAGFASYGRPKKSEDSPFDASSDALTALFAEMGVFFCF